ncbi:MAG: hypothetical protein ACRDE6_03335 [Candidatus Limnocylindria bacterium]
MHHRLIAALCLGISIAVAGCSPSDDGGQGTDAPPAATPSPTVNDDAGAGDDY